MFKKKRAENDPAWHLHWKLTSEFLLLLFTHPVDSETGCSSKTTPQDLLVGLGLPVTTCTRVLWGKTHKNREVTTDTFKLILSFVHRFCSCALSKPHGLQWHTGNTRWTRAALAAELLQGVDSYIEVDVLTATALIHQPLLIKGLKTLKPQNCSTKAQFSTRDIILPCWWKLGVIHTIWKATSSDGQNLTHSSMKVLR